MNSNLPEVADQVETKLLTMSQILTSLDSITDSTYLPDVVRKFKLSMVKKSLSDVISLIEASDLVQSTMMKKIKSDIEIYPITTLLDIMESINGIVDRNLKIMESILPKTEDLSAFLAATRTVNFINAPVSLEGRSPATLEKISMIAELVISQMNKVVSD